MAVSSLLRKILPETLDADTFAVSEERPSDAFMSRVTLVLQQHLSTEAVTRTSQVVSTVSSKTVGVVDRTAPVQEAAKLLVSACFAFGGRSPYSPDVVLVNENVLQPFLEAVIQHSSKYSRVTQTNEEERKPSSSSDSGSLKRLGEAPGTRVVVSGSDWGVVEVQDW